MRKRSIDKHFRFTEKENNLIQDLARKTHLSENEVVVTSLSSIILKEAPSRSFYYDLEKINKIGVNINQIAKVANQTGVIMSNKLYECIDGLDELVNDLRKKYL